MNKGKLTIPVAPFLRLVREITQVGIFGLRTCFIANFHLQNDIVPHIQATSAQTITGFRFTRAAMKALHHISEIYLVNLFEDSYTLAIYCHRVTLKYQDIMLACLLHGDTVCFESYSQI